MAILFTSCVCDLGNSSEPPFSPMSSGALSPLARGHSAGAVRNRTGLPPLTRWLTNTTSSGFHGFPLVGFLMTPPVSGTVETGVRALRLCRLPPSPKLLTGPCDLPEWPLWFSCPQKQVKPPAGRGDSESHLSGDRDSGESGVLLPADANTGLG